jgi:hypothetical protein
MKINEKRVSWVIVIVFISGLFILGAAAGAFLIRKFDFPEEDISSPGKKPDLPGAVTSKIRVKNVASELGIGIVDKCPGELSAEEQKQVEIEEKKELGRVSDFSLEPPSNINCMHTFSRTFGSGVAVGDYDNDGDPDIYAVAHGPPEKKPLSRLFRNDGSKGFTDVTEISRTGNTGWGSGAYFADFDGDGWLDLYVTNFGPNVLYHNKGDGTFDIVPDAGGTGMGVNSSSAAIADADGDGDLDLFVATSSKFIREYGVGSFTYPYGMSAYKDAIFLNRGNGTFYRPEEKTVIEITEKMGLGAVFFDFDLDGDPDLYVCNDREIADFYENINGRFIHGGYKFGLEDIMAGMGIATGDYNGDLYPDIFITHYLTEPDSLYKNPGSFVDSLHCHCQDGLFSMDTCRAGLFEQGIFKVAWGTVFNDLDLDGDQDLVIVRGNTSSNNGGLPVEMPKGVFENNGNGTFNDVSDSSGINAHGISNSRGLALLDYDQDGVMDFVVSNINSPVELFHNESEHGNSITIRLRMDGKNRYAIGASVVATAGGKKQIQQVIGGGTYLSCSTTDLIFGLGDAAEAEDIAVLWPWHREFEHFGSFKAGKVYVIKPKREEKL